MTRGAAHNSIGKTKGKTTKKQTKISVAKQKQKPKKNSRQQTMDNGPRTGQGQ